MTRILRQIALLLICTVATIMTATGAVGAVDVFFDAALTAEIMRDVHLVGVDGSRIGNATISNGQNTSISYYQFGVAANIWNNERNQVLAGIQYGRREFDGPLALPGGVTMPERLDTASAGIIYKHITSGDWSLSQAVRYTQSWTANPSITVRDTVDLVGLAAVSPEPGVAWAFGYIYDQSDFLDPALLPVIEYVNAAHDQWTFVIGFPILNVAYSPHPYWVLGGGAYGGAIVSYKVTPQNIVSLSYGANNWAYQLDVPNEKGVGYSAKRTGLDWTYAYFIDHRTVAVFNASLGWEFDRKFGQDYQLTIGDAAVVGLFVGLSFY